MRKKKDVLAHIAEYEHEYKWIAEKIGISFERWKETLGAKFSTTAEWLRDFAYDEQHKDADNGKG